MSPSTIALLGALVAVAGGQVAMFASPAARKRDADAGVVADRDPQHDRSGAPEGLQ